MSRRLLTLIVLGLIGLAGCGPAGCGAGDNGVSADTTPPKVEVYVLVDLSATWNTPEAQNRNLRLLGEVGEGVAAVADTVEPPVAAQYRVIGAASLGREPLCDVLYTPSLMQLRKNRRPGYEYNDSDKLKQYLGVECPALIVRQPPEPLTQISAAIASVANDPPLRPDARRYIVILSDFREETGGAPAPAAKLNGYRVLMIYRPLSEDQASPADMAARVEQWRVALTESGAKVTVTADTALKRATIASFLTRR